ncbi:MAG: DUF424 family protein [archaeon]
MIAEKFIVKEIDSKNGIILVITDPELLGKKFETEMLQLDLSNSFYQGEKKSAEKVLAMINKAYILHITGEKALRLVSDLGLIDQSKVLKIDNIPHAEVYLGE